MISTLRNTRMLDFFKELQPLGDNVVLGEDKGIFASFLAISTWQSAVTVIAFLGILVGFWLFMKKKKIKFIYRVLMGMSIGLLFGLILQIIAGFPEFGLFQIKDGADFINEAVEGGTWEGHQVVVGDYWAYELNIWSQLFKNIFINGILMLTAPVVFLAIFRVTSRPGARGVGRITVKGIALLLINVTFAFVITFGLGMLLKVGDGAGLVLESGDKEFMDNKPFAEIIWNYFPSNFAGAWVAGGVIPLMILGVLFGSSVKLLSKRKPDQMKAIRNAMDTGYSVVTSVMMTFMKIMPLAVASMMLNTLISKPIGSIATMGKALGVGYLGLLISLGFLTLLLFVSRVKVGQWWKLGLKPLIQGFATQSSNATLPVTMSTLKDEMKVNDNVVGTIAPLSTSMGLMGCAGVQAGLITSFLWTGTGAGTDVHDMALFTYFITALIVTIIASLGIAGVPGTAAVVTAGVLGGLGLGAWFAPVYAIVGALDGLFDMGRTGTNVIAGAAVATIVGKSEGLIEEGSTLLTEKQLDEQKALLLKINSNEDAKEAKAKAESIRFKERAKLSSEANQAIKAIKKEIAIAEDAKTLRAAMDKLDLIKEEYRIAKEKANQAYAEVDAQAAAEKAARKAEAKRIKAITTEERRQTAPARKAEASLIKKREAEARKAAAARRANARKEVRSSR
nr:cation:dicarboxylase symporter family transporter [Mesoplasma photuris]